MRIDLPCLDILGLNELGGTTIGFLLSSIVTPSSCYPQVMVRGERYDSLSSLSPLENSLLKGFSRSYRSSLMSAGATFGVRMELGAADDWRCLLYLSSFDTNSPAEDLSIIIAVLLSGIRKLEIDGLELLLHGLSDRLHLLPLLEELKIYSQESDDYPELRDALKQTITKFASGSSPDQPSQVICPLLRRIVLDTFHFDMDCVVKLVLVRTPAEVEEFKNKVRLELVELGEQFEPDDPTLGMLHQLATDRNVELRVGKLSEW
ncbi:hypothetical protein FRC03_006986 [Tulasnella sp. 419]|nr:hypothetical protein FRC03_006986 [Tulasnella sp. 419]